MERDRGGLLNSIFSLDNSVMRFFSRVYDLAVLNIIFITCCIPVVTIGASITALYSITLKMVRNEEPHIIRGFLKAFKENLKQGSIIGIIATIITAFIIIDLRIISLIGDYGFATVVKILCYAVAIWGYIVFLYAFPILARFKSTVKEIFKNSFILSVINIKWTIIMLLFNIPYIAMLLYSGVTMMILFTILILIGFSTLALAQGFIFRKIFDKYEDLKED